MEGDLDVNSLVDSIADDMDIGKEVEDVVEETTEEVVDENVDETTEVVDETTDTEEVADEVEVEEAVDEEVVDETIETLREAPKSWAKEQHEVWSKLPSEAQDYIEHREKQMLDGIDEYREFATYGRELNNVITPYSPMFEQAGIDVKTGVQYLLNAQYMLQQGTPEQKEGELRRIAEQYGINLGEKATGGEEKLDPRMEQMQNTINQLQNKIEQGEQTNLTEMRAKNAQEVDDFANDGNHPYFDELTEEIAIQIKAGKSLPDAYDTAIFANPVTKAKEIARIHTENAAKLKEKKQQEVKKAIKATSSNVRAIETTRTPTETKGKLFSSEFDTDMLKKAKAGLATK